MYVTDDSMESVAMFLGGVILKRRIDLDMTQKNLADGICNQNVISKIERQNTPPAINNLIQICQKLKLTLNDVYSEFSVEDRQDRIELLNSISEDIFHGNIQIANEKLTILHHSKLSKNEQIQSLFYEALILSENGNNSPTFALDKLLTLTTNDVYNVFTLLAYILRGKQYLRHGEIDDAKYFYNLVKNETNANVDIPNASVTQKIFICKSLAEFYIKYGERTLAADYIQRGINICDVSHQLSFLGELYQLFAQITRDENATKIYMNRSKVLKNIHADPIIHSK